jgi:hypothetical protein
MHSLTGESRLVRLLPHSPHSGCYKARTKTAALFGSKLYRLSLSGIHEWRCKYKSVCPYDSSKVSRPNWSFTNSAFTAVHVSQWLQSGFNWMLAFTPAPRHQSKNSWNSKLSNYVSINQTVTREMDSPGSHSH